MTNKLAPGLLWQRVAVLEHENTNVWSSTHFEKGSNRVTSGIWNIPDTL